MSRSHQKILILDFGSQLTQLIARRVREQQVYCELHPFDVSDDFVREFKPQGIILSGGPNSVYEATEWKAPQAVFELGVPVLGICYGMQTMAEQLGGKVESVNSVTPKCVPVGTPNSLRVCRIARTTQGMACSMSG